MKHFHKKSIILIAIATIFLSGNVVHAGTVNVPVTATVVLATLGLSSTSDLDFGTIISDQTTSSTLTINATGGSVSSVTVTGPANVTGGSSGAIAITTNIDANVTIAWTIQDADTNPNQICVAGDSANRSMACTAGNIQTNSTSSPLAITTAGATVNVGGVLSVTNSQPAGAYTGTITATINYQ